MMNLERGCGLLLHITSLPSKYGIGDFGPAAYEFVDLLAESDLHYWQILPLNPVDSAYGNSPYLSNSAFAINPLLISPDILVKDGLLDKKDIIPTAAMPQEHVDYQAVRIYKNMLFEKAFQNWKSDFHKDYNSFCKEDKFWLGDYALFMALKEKFHGQIWSEWPIEYRDRHPKFMETARKELEQHIEKIEFQQFLLHKQWFALKSFCNKKRIQILGDLPIYVDFGSADVWCFPDRFKLDETKRPSVVAGVPPDFFSATGQRWGNPIYNWDKMKQEKFTWWKERLSENFNLFDIVRIDHFRGLVAYWEVPAIEETAINGQWVKAPTEDFFKELQSHFPKLNVVAEDLGHITQDVKEALQKYQLPGMKVLLFAFNSDLHENPYLPHNYESNCIAYTGNHDLNTCVGWFFKEAQDFEKENFLRYLGRSIEESEVHWELIDLAMTSAAQVVIIPVQDVLGLDENGRMNIPGTATGNWEWRLLADQLDQKAMDRFALLTRKTGRA